MPPYSHPHGQRAGLSPDQGIEDNANHRGLTKALPYPEAKVTTQRPVVRSHTEWDPLEEVIVGRVDHACVPTWHPVLGATMPAKHWDFFQTQGGGYFPEELLQAAAGELDHLAARLEAEGITVKRRLSWTKFIQVYTSFLY